MEYSLSGGKMNNPVQRDLVSGTHIQLDMLGDDSHLLCCIHLLHRRHIVLTNMAAPGVTTGEPSHRCGMS